MKAVIIIITLLVNGFCYSQSSVKTEVDIYESVDESATFPNGINAFRQEFINQLNLNKVFGVGKNSTIIDFIVEKDGTIADIKATGENISLNHQSIIAIKKINTKWKPAKVKNTKVRSRFRFPITVNLT